MATCADTQHAPKYLEHVNVNWLHWLLAVRTLIISAHMWIAIGRQKDPPIIVEEGQSSVAFGQDICTACKTVVTYSVVVVSVGLTSKLSVWLLLPICTRLSHFVATTHPSPSWRKGDPNPRYRYWGTTPPRIGKKPCDWPVNLQFREAYPLLYRFLFGAVIDLLEQSMHMIGAHPFLAHNNTGSF